MSPSKPAAPTAVATARPAASAPRTRNAAAAPMSLHIERLVLQDLPLSRRDGARLERAFQSELGRLLASGRFSQDVLAGRAVHRLQLDDLRLKRDAGPEQLGRALAGALLRGLAP